MRNILTSLQMESNEIRLLTTQYFNDSLYVLDSQIIKCSGLEDFYIKDKNAVSSSILEAVNNTNKKLNIKIKNILLSIPSYRVNIQEEAFKFEYKDRHIITSEDIKDILNKGYNINVGNDYQIINVYCNEYSVNDITSIKTPVGLMANSLSCTLQIVSADKLVTYSYADVVEMCGLNVLDVCLDSYALTKEMASFENSYNNYNIGINIETEHSIFVLTYNGKILETELMSCGYSKLANKLTKTFYLPLRKSEEIIFKFLDLNKTKFDNQATFVWGGKDQINSIDDEQLYLAVQKEINEWFKQYKDLCQEIVQLPNVSIKLAGLGANINNIEKYLSKMFNKEVDCYKPNCLGARDPSWTVCLGAIYNYIDQNKIYQRNDCSIISEEQQEIIEDTNEQSIDIKDKVKNLFFEEVEE